MLIPLKSFSMLQSLIHISIRGFSGLRGCLAGALSVLLLTVATACVEREVLSADDAVMDVHVSFMWNHAEGAVVEGMTVYMFPADDGGRIWRFDLPGREGGLIRLPRGEYRMIAVNNDLPGVRISDTGAFSSIMANAVDIPDMNGMTQPTGMLYGSVVERVRVDGCGVRYLQSDGSVKECPRGLLRCSPDSMSTVYNLILRDVHLPANTTVLGARLSGLNSAMLLSTATPSGHETSAAFSLWRGKSGEVDGVTSDFAPAREATSLSLKLIATTSAGEKYEKVYDVSRQALNSTSLRNVYILITDADFPDDDSGHDGDDVGMQVGVDGWQEVEIEYDTSGMSYLRISAL